MTERGIAYLIEGVKLLQLGRRDGGEVDGSNGHWRGDGLYRMNPTKSVVSKRITERHMNLEGLVRHEE